jgi:anti-sigma regulatory factor (Ser/Thr protein kinase)
LSLVNQLASTTRRVSLHFEEGEAGTMGYLNRMGFFDHLADGVEVFPARPSYSAAELHRGGNTALVEIARINKDGRDQELPTRLTNALMRSCRARGDAAELKGAAWTIFAELIDNIFSHSRTELDGYAALQVYSRGDRLSVAVSDSGLGIMETLRPTLRAEFSSLVGLSDTELLVEVFRQGLSRHGRDRGCGLKGSAAKAIKFNATLDVRLPTQRVLLTPARGIYEANTADCYEGLPLVWGTHIAFDFRLGA